MEEFINSVTLDKDKCKGCTNCIKTCPTEAIRVRNGKAYIIKERCIDCGECIRVCPHHAKKAVADKLEMIGNYQKAIALPAPSFYGQFPSEYSRKKLLIALKNIGFDGVFEVAAGAELVSAETEKRLQTENFKKPMISSACPAVVRLIQMRFPGLIDNILKLESPMQISAVMARKLFSEKFGISENELGIFFISPCAAKVTAVKSPIGIKKSAVNGVIPISEIYGLVHESLKNTEDDNQTNIFSSDIGVGWAGSGGESNALSSGKTLAVDGIQNIIKVFEQIENDKIENVVFIEALSCPEGCLGGPLAVENRYVAKSRLKQHMEEAKSEKAQIKPVLSKAITWSEPIFPSSVLKLDDDVMIALGKIEQIEKIEKDLPGLDCGACGAPNCKALAEDIVRGIAKETDCVFKLRERVRQLASEMIELESELPHTMNRTEKNEN
ncbi:MAG: 4Fe-4S binding protein [Clostridia bacterium]|nr:4Fe-4S binding protein [Clostridia bacterium]